MEPSKNEWITPLKIGHLYLNRFTIDEEAAFEIRGIHNLAPSQYEMSVGKIETSEFVRIVNSELKQTGTELLNNRDVNVCGLEKIKNDSKSTN